MSNFDYVLGVAAAGLDDLYGGDMEDGGYGNGYYDHDYDDHDYDDDDLDFDNDHALDYAGLGHEPFLDDQFPELASEPSLPVHSSPVPWSDDLSDSGPYEEDRDGDDLDTTVTLHEEDLPEWGNNRAREWERISGSGSGSGSGSPSAGGSSAALNNSSSSPSPSPYPAAAVWPEPISRDSSVSGSASNLFVDSDVPSARSPASPAASASGTSSPASASSGASPAPQHQQWRPQGQQPPARQRVGLHHPRASPRRPSLTPTIHPNRRLPRPANLQQQRQPHHHQPRHRLVPPSEDDFPASVYDHIDSLLPSALPSSDPDDFSPVRASAAHDLPRVSGGGGSGSGSGSGSGANARPPNPHSRLLRPGLAHLLDSDSEEASQTAPPRQSRLQPSRHRQVAGESQEAHVPSPGIPWDSDFDWGADMDIDDELIEVIVDHHRQAPSVQEQGQQRQHHDHQQQRRRHRHLAHPRQLMQGDSSGNLERQDAAAVDVIDLTEEPDSPVLLHHRPINLRRNAGPDHANRQQNPRNPRRQMSQAGRTPSLARSDGSILNQTHPAAAVIDLTNNSDEDPDIPFNRRLPAPVPAARRDNRRSVEVVGIGRHYMPALAELGNLSRLRDLFPGLVAARLGAHNDAEVQIIGAHQFAMNANPLAGNQPAFNYQANGFGGRQPTPKPEFQPPPCARPGFTRDTGLDKDTDEEMVIVCASCDNELKYSANEEDDGGHRPAKRPRTKKDREEHHFWAVKTCGHVYCKHCYDNRKKTKSKDYEKLGFQVDNSHKIPKIFCAVDQCNSDVTSTQVWVGIFM